MRANQKVKDLSKKSEWRAMFMRSVPWTCHVQDDMTSHDMPRHGVISHDWISYEDDMI